MNKLNLGYRFNIFMLLNLIFVILLTLFILIMFESFDSSYFTLTVLYLVFNFAFIFLPQEKINNIAVYTIRITGIFRYVLIPISMKINQVKIEDKNIKLFMIIELIIVYTIVILYYAQYRSKFVKKIFHWPFPRSKYLASVKENKLFFGISLTIIVIVAVLLLSVYSGYLSQYFVISRNKEALPDVHGFVAMILSAFFLLLFITALDIICRISMLPEFVKIILSVICSIFFINGTSITSTNISRWSLIINFIIACYFIVHRYPKYTKKIVYCLIPLFAAILFFGTIYKFTLWTQNNNEVSITSIFDNVLGYKSLNAYFSGPDNINEALELNEIVENQSIPRTSIFISDTFGNCPGLNKWTDSSVNSGILFNYHHYQSFIANDQIIPLSGQIYLIFGIFYPIFLILIILLALIFSEKLAKTKSPLLVYSFCYLSFSFALGNCINYTIMMQNFWIHILPALLIYMFNYRYRIVS